MLYKKVAGFGDYDILEPAIKEIDIMDFQNETAKECVDVPFTIVGKEKETEKDKQKMEISDSFVTGFAIFVIAFGLIMLKICSNKVLISAWICTALVVIESMIINQNADNAWVLLIPGLITLTNFVGFGGDKDDME